VSIIYMREKRNKGWYGSDTWHSPNHETVEISQTLLSFEHQMPNIWPYDVPWSLSFTAPYMEIVHEYADQPDRVTSGIGDVIVSGNWFIIGKPPEHADMEAWLRLPSYSLILSGGLSLPTGSIERIPEFTESTNTETFIPLGAGVVRPMIGIHAMIDWGGLVGHLQFSKVATVKPNRYGYEPGDNTTYRVGLGARVQEDVQVGLMLDMSHLQTDKVNGRKLARGGGWRCAVQPQMQWRPSPDYTIYGAVNVPFYHSYDFPTLDSRCRLEIGIRFNF